MKGKIMPGGDIQCSWKNCVNCRKLAEISTGRMIWKPSVRLFRPSFAICAARSNISSNPATCSLTKLSDGRAPQAGGGVAGMLGQRP